MSDCDQVIRVIFLDEYYLLHVSTKYYALHQFFFTVATTVTTKDLSIIHGIMCDRYTREFKLDLNEVKAWYLYGFDYSVLNKLDRMLKRNTIANGYILHGLKILPKAVFVRFFIDLIHGMLTKRCA